MNSFLSASAAALLLSGSLANAATYELDVEGLDCPICAYSLEREVSKIAGIVGFAFDFQTGLVLITMENGVVLARETAEQAVDKVGYALHGFKEISSP